MMVNNHLSKCSNQFHVFGVNIFQNVSVGQLIYTAIFIIHCNLCKDIIYLQATFGGYLERHHLYSYFYNPLQFVQRQNIPASHLEYLKVLNGV